MNGQASIEGLFYYIVLLIGVAAVILMIFNYIQEREKESLRYNLYIFHNYIESKYTSLNRVGDNSYVELYLPPKIAGDDYYIFMNRSHNDHTSATVFVILSRNITYAFPIRLSYTISDANKTVTLVSGRRYIISIENGTVYVR
ncbi:MAG: hypothetical protein NZ908_00200 [Candidatus Micrarchaeota archaeon]|nr:hypothetical protein [Candidatus Micrarchaeota archaeon]MCX8154213.1 hypothetical protein [Candidatus Micrarchaeota archaeon]